MLTYLYYYMVGLNPYSLTAAIPTAIPTATPRPSIALVRRELVALEKLKGSWSYYVTGQSNKKECNENR